MKTLTMRQRGSAGLQTYPKRNAQMRSLRVEWRQRRQAPQHEICLRIAHRLGLSMKHTSNFNYRFFLHKAAYALENPCGLFRCWRGSQH